ncbi:hypothetical protein HII31_05344 [Pseudocercospora fuligena]|uniref:Yeast cell wall synthesis Kre9/Knh1-like N-terminal domain-containing protein n=1 Tax=Pseudocercospora fuligena TaxID=685502 RepID=A0A8H6RK85_9PEZI|nr:hypothetical protein HII31_05344 [Pseudocercospora fuligena]
MHALTMRYAALLATFAGAALALDGIVAPSTVKAGEDFNVAFENANDDNYRVYLAASLSGSNGPTCYLINSTTLNTNTTINLTIPPGVGPSATYYSIAISDITTGQGATYSNRFNLTGANGNYTEYENGLNGSPFWSANSLPCDSYKCARECAMEYYPEDLKETDAYNKMKDCILDCDGVTPAASQTKPAQASATASSSTSEEASSTESGTAETSSGAANRQVYAAGAAAAGFGALAFLL